MTKLSQTVVITTEKFEIDENSSNYNSLVVGTIDKLHVLFGSTSD